MEIKDLFDENSDISNCDIGVLAENIGALLEHVVETSVEKKVNDKFEHIIAENQRVVNFILNLKKLASEGLRNEILLQVEEFKI